MRVPIEALRTVAQVAIISTPIVIAGACGTVPPNPNQLTPTPPPRDPIQKFYPGLVPVRYVTQTLCKDQKYNGVSHPTVDIIVINYSEHPADNPDGVNITGRDAVVSDPQGQDIITAGLIGPSTQGFLGAINERTRYAVSGTVRQKRDGTCDLAGASVHTAGVPTSDISFPAIRRETIEKNFPSAKQQKFHGEPIAYNLRRNLTPRENHYITPANIRA